MASQLKPRRPYLFAGFFLVAGIFLVFMQTFKITSSPSLRLQKLEKAGKIKILSEWQISLMCRMGGSLQTCSAEDKAFFTLNLPSPEQLMAKIKESVIPPTRAHLTYRLNEAELQWLKKQGLSAFVAPSLIHHQSTLTQGDSQSFAIGFKATGVFPIDIKQVLSDEQLTLDIDFKGYPIFGPSMMIPFALVNHEAINEYSALSTQYFMSSLVLRGQEFTLFLLLAAMALILDHSLAFGFLSMYILGQSGRQLFYFFADVGTELPHYLHWLRLMTYTLTTISLPLFIAATLGFRPQKKFILGFSFISFLGILWYSRSVDLATLKLDIYGDLVASTLGLGVIIYLALIKPRLRSNKNRTKAEKDGRIWQLIFSFKTLLLLSLLAIKIWVNIDELISLDQKKLKDILDWKHYIHFPGLVLAALIDVGSTSKAMMKFAKKMVQQALVEKDIAAGKAVQESMLPLRRQQSDHWSWRCFYFPATTLAGDWYDLKEVNLKDGSSVLLACIADVTGHGVGAAMMTSIISSSWEKFCKTLANTATEKDISAGEVILGTVIEDINQSLLALRGSKGCTLACLLYHPQTRKLTYATPGHPGILMQGVTGALKYLAAPGTRLGGEELKYQVNSLTILEKSDLILFTDGLATPKQSLNQWLKSCTRLTRDHHLSLSTVLLRQARTNKKHFRNNPDDEDDMTIVFLTFGQDFGEKEAQKNKIAS